MIGKTILHYKIIEKLGQGGMGIVYKAEDSKLKRQVAIKFLPHHIAANSDERKRFEIEAQAAAALNHPNIATIYAIEETDDEIFLVMEYIEGRELKDLIGDPSVSPISKGVAPGDSLSRGLRGVLNIAIQIVEGLQAAHEKGIVHRDIKSSNIMVTDKGKIKIMDFGLAKFRGSAQLTQLGTTVGTAAYMSPEQARGEEADQCSDIWSFGVVLYEMLSGTLPFADEYEQAVIYAILNSEPKEISGNDVPQQLKRTVEKSLRKNRDERYQSVKEILNDLSGLQDETKALSTQMSRKADYNTTVIKYLAGIILILVLVVAGFMWFNFSAKSDNVQKPLNIVPLTRYAGTEDLPSFSPDGNQIAFDWDGPHGDNTDIYIKVIGTESISRLTTDPGYDFHPGWSPDGRMIAYKQYINENDYKVYLVSPLGGLARKLIDIKGPVRLYNWERTLDWHPTGAFIVVNGPAADGESASLFMISVKTGEKIRLTHPPSSLSYGDTKAIFSSDGRKLVFVRMVSEDVSDLYLLELSENGNALGEPRRITFQEIFNRGVVFLPGDDEIVYSAGSALWRLSLSDKAEPKQIMQIEGLTEIALSRQGDKLAYVKERNSTNIVRVVISDKRIVTGKPEILIPSTVIDLSASYSPDGERIAFYSTRSGHGEVWVCDANGSNLLQLTDYGNWTGGPSWSPDGKFLAVDSRIEGQSEIYIIPSDGGQARRLTDNPADDHWPNWSHDGKWIYFSSTRSGREEVWKVSVDGKKELQLTKNGGTAPKESPDGQRIYYQKDFPLYYLGLWHVPVNGGKEQQILEQCYLSSFHILKNGIYFIAHTDSVNRVALQYFSFKTGKTEIIHRIEDNNISVGLSVSPDQKAILYSKVNDLGSDIDIIENFR